MWFKLGSRGQWVSVCVCVWRWRKWEIVLDSAAGYSRQKLVSPSTDPKSFHVPESHKHTQTLKFMCSCLNWPYRFLYDTHLKLDPGAGFFQESTNLISLSLNIWKALSVWQEKNDPFMHDRDKNNTKVDVNSGRKWIRVRIFTQTATIKNNYGPVSMPNCSFMFSYLQKMRNNSCRSGARGRCGKSLRGEYCRLIWFNSHHIIWFVGIYVTYKDGCLQKSKGGGTRSEIICIWYLFFKMEIEK